MCVDVNVCCQRAITILDLEKGLPRCLRDKVRSGVEKDLSAMAGGDRDRRRCFRSVSFKGVGRATLALAFFYAN